MKRCLKKLISSALVACLMFGAGAGVWAVNPTTHRVVSGDSWWGLSRQYGVNMTELARLNGRTTTQHISVGEVLTLPGGTVTPTPGARTHRVVSGDSWWGISRQYGVNMTELARLNGRSTTQHLSVGEVLTLPGGGSTPSPTPAPTPVSRTHRVVSGDSWWGISRQYGVNMNELARINGRTTTQFLRVGEVLTLPGGTNAPTPTPTPVPQPTPSTQQHTVRSGESWWAISRQYGVNMNELARINGHTTSSMLRVGQVLTIPNGAPVTSSIRVVAQPVGNFQQYQDVPVVQNEGGYSVTMIPITNQFARNGGYGDNIQGVTMGYAIKTPNGRTVMIDGGGQLFVPGTTNPLTGYGSGAVEPIRQWLAKNANNTVDAWFLSHQHNDHANALATIIHDPKGINIQRMYSTLYPITTFKQKTTATPTHEIDYVYNAINKRKQAGAYTETTTGQVFTIDGLKIEVFRHADMRFWRVNDQGLVLKLTFGNTGKTMLFLGDTQADSAAWLVSTYGSRLKSDIVSLGHHGLDALPELYARIDADYALANGSQKAPSGHYARMQTNLAATGATHRYLAEDRWVTIYIK